MAQFYYRISDNSYDFITGNLSDFEKEYNCFDKELFTGDLLIFSPLAITIDIISY